MNKKYDMWNMKISPNKTLYKNQKKYGDTDLDGSPNKFDCDPLDASKDGLLGRALNIVSKGKFGQSKEDYQKERITKKSSRASFAKRLLAARQKAQIKKIVSPRKTGKSLTGKVVKELLESRKKTLEFERKKELELLKHKLKLSRKVDALDKPRLNWT